MNIGKVINSTTSHSLQNISSIVSNSPVMMNTIHTTSPLSSASLLCSFFENYFVRSAKVPTKEEIVKILSADRTNSALWNTVEDYTPRIRAYKQQLRTLERAKRMNPDSKMNLVDDIKNLKLLTKWMEESDAADKLDTIHPTSNDGRKILNRLLGLEICLKGPKRGGRAESKTFRIGRTSDRDDTWNSERAVTQICSPIGTFGLTCVIVWGKKGMLTRSV